MCSSFRVVVVSPAPVLIISGYQDANDADRLRHDPAFQILADQPLGSPRRITTDSQPLGEPTIASRSPPPLGCSARLVCEDLRKTGSPAGAGYFGKVRDDIEHGDCNVRQLKLKADDNEAAES